MHRASLAASLLFAITFGCGTVGCGGGAEPEPEATTGGEAVAPEAAAPLGPPPSYLPESARVVVRIDMARVRSLPVGPDIASARRATPTWQRLAGGSGIDPVQDFDTILVGSDEIYSERQVVLLRHVHTEAEVRQRVLAMAVDRGATPEWRDVDGVAVVAWPMPRTSLSYSLAIVAANELVLAPDDELARIAAVARDHAQRRGADATLVVEPHLTAMRPTEIVTMNIGVPLPARAGYPDPPQTTRVDVDATPEGNAVIAVRSEFESDAQATAAQQWVDQQRAFYAAQTMVRAIGMHRPLEEATVTVEGPRLALGASVTADEMRRLLGLMALSQLAGTPTP